MIGEEERLVEPALPAAKHAGKRSSAEENDYLERKTRKENRGLPQRRKIRSSVPFTALGCKRRLLKRRLT